MENPKRLSLQSADGAQLNLDALYQIAPSCFTEAADPKTGKIKRMVNFDTLRQLLGDDAVEDAPEAYEFNWVGKQAARAEVLRPIRKTLRPVKEDSVDWDTTQNLYIEGDNLEVLKLLQKSYLGKVKMIYIDPPYNTGNDFVYHDDFARSQAEENLAAGNVDELGNRFIKNTDSNGRYHSDWCSMIYSRLMVARSLLSDDGAIFISIDDNEVENLKKICNEIFGECNCLTTFAWVNSLKDNVDEDTKFAGSNLGVLKKSHEYVLVYAKELFKLGLDFSKNPYIVKLVTNGGNAIQTLRIPKGLKCVSKITKTIRGHVGGKSDYYDILTQEGMIFVDGVLQNDVEIQGPLRNPVMLTKFFNGEEVIDNKGQKLVEVFSSETGMLHTKKLRAGNTVSTVLVGKGTTKNGTLLLKELFGSTVFDYAKPVELISYILSKHADKDFTVLDFFSGSGTTAHSVFLQNIEQNRNIKFILVQLAEEIDPDKATTPAAKKTAQAAIDYLMRQNKPFLLTELAKERLKLSAKKIKEESPLTTQDLDTGFRVFRVDSSNYEEVEHTPKDWNQQELDLFLNNIKSDRTDLDLLFGCMLDWGVQLSLPMTTEEVDGKNIYTVNEGDLVACFADKVTDNVVRAMAEKQPLRVIFRDSCFERDADKINIYETFKQLLDWSDQEVVKNIRVI